MSKILQQFQVDAVLIYTNTLYIQTCNTVAMFIRLIGNLLLRSMNQFRCGLPTGSHRE